MEGHSRARGSSGPLFPRRRFRRDRLIVLEGIVLGLGAALALLVVFEVLGSVVVKSGGDSFETAIQVTAGLFAVQLTVVTFVLVFAVDTSIDWPSLRSVVRHSGLIPWLVAGFLGFGLFGFAGGASQREAVTLFCIGVVLAGFIPIKLLFDLTSDRGRDQLLIHDLEASQGLRRYGLSLTGSSPAPSSESATLLHSYMSVFQASLNEAGLQDLESLVRQLTSSRMHDRAAEDASILVRAQLHLWCIQRVARAMLFGEIRSASSAELIGNLTASLCRCTVVDRRLAGRLDPASEVQAASLLGVSSRFLAWTARVAARMADAVVSEGALADQRSFYAYQSLFEVARSSQGVIGKQVDPDPPDVFLPASERNRSHGITDPQAGLIWWLLSVDQNGSGPGVYQMAEILTGEKFFGSFGWGYRSVLGEVADRLAGLPRDEEHTRFPVRQESAELLESYRGFGSVSAEALALGLSSWEEFDSLGIGSSAGFAYSGNPERFARRVRVFCLGDPEFSPDEEGLAQALERVARFTGPSDRPPLFSDHAFAKAREVFVDTDPPIPQGGRSLVFPPLIPLRERPGAAVLSVVIRCVDFSAAAKVDSEFVRELLCRLPLSLLEMTFETAVRVFPGDTLPTPQAREPMIDELVERLRMLEADIQETGGSGAR